MLPLRSGVEGGYDVTRREQTMEQWAKGPIVLSDRTRLHSQTEIMAK